MRGERGRDGRVVERASVAAHILLKALETLFISQAPSLCHPVSISGTGRGCLAGDEWNRGGRGRRGAVGKSDWIHTGLEGGASSVQGVGVGE